MLPYFDSLNNNAEMFCKYCGTHINEENFSIEIELCEPCFRECLNELAVNIENLIEQTEHLNRKFPK